MILKNSRYFLLSLLVIGSAQAKSWIIGEGIEDRRSHQKIHLVATDLDESGYPRYVQFQLTRENGNTQPIGPNLLVHGTIRDFIHSFAILNRLAKDVHQRRTFQVTRAVYTGNSLRVNGKEWTVAVNLIGGAIGWGVWSGILQPETTGQELGAYALGMVSAPMVIDLFLFPFTAIADLFDPNLRFPFAKSLDLLDSRDRENWLLRTRKVPSSQFENIRSALIDLEQEDAFERRTLPPRENDVPRGCKLTSPGAAINSRLKIKEPGDSGEGQTPTLRLRSRIKSISNDIEFQVVDPVVQRSEEQDQKWRSEEIQRRVDTGKSSSTYSAALQLKDSRQMIPWTIQSGLYRRELEGKKQLCVRAVIDSQYATEPYVIEECGALSGKKKENYLNAMELSKKLNQRLKAKQPTCEDGLLVFPND